MSKAPYVSWHSAVKPEVSQGEEEKATKVKNWKFFLEAAHAYNFWFGM